MTRSEKKRNRVRDAIVKSLGMGASVVASCTAAGIGTTTFYRWCQEDEGFELRVMEARMGLIEEVMGELRLQAMGRYVDEVKVVETARGPRVEKRHRWVNGKTSACMALIRIVERDGKVLAKLFGATEADVEEPQMDTDGHRFEQEDRGEGTTKGTKGTKIGEENVARVSRFEGEMGGEGIAGRAACGHHGERKAGIAGRAACGHHFGGEEDGAETARVARFEGEELTTEGHGEGEGSLKAVLHTSEVARVSRSEAKRAKKAKRKAAKASRRHNRR